MMVDTSEADWRLDCMEASTCVADAIMDEYAADIVEDMSDAT